jgi:hypothetical protein
VLVAHGQKSWRANHKRGLHWFCMAHELKPLTHTTMPF